MRPTIGMDRHKFRILKCMCSLDRVVTVHGEMKRSARFGRARKQNNQTWQVAAGNLCDTLVPNGVAGYVNQVARFFAAQEKADHIAGNRLDANRAMARRCCGDMEPDAAGSIDLNRLSA
jgi:hypothetical protein